MDIILNIYDLYKIGKHFKLNNTKQLFERGYITLAKGQNEVTVPKIRFKTDPYSFCPFLINDIDEDFNLKGFCSLHPYIKPLVCILAPISKEYSAYSDITNYSFTIPTNNCPGVDSKYKVTVKESIEPVTDEIEYEKLFFKCLDKIIEEGIINYSDKLYFFDLNKDFNTILDSLI